jgi:predicted transposase YbfD/YdcC
MVIPLLECLDLTGKTVTADALLTQRKLAAYLVRQHAHYVFVVKENQPTLHDSIRRFFEDRGQPHFSEPPTLAHGRIESRRIWTTSRFNHYLDFPGIGQAFVMERYRLNKKTAQSSLEIVYGITSHTPHTASAEAVLRFNRNHWSIENSCHYILDWNRDEDRGTIRTGNAPENMTALRRFAVGLILSKTKDTVASTIQRLARNTRRQSSTTCV